MVPRWYTKAISAFRPSGVGKWVPALAGKAKAGMVHSVSGWTRGVQVKLWDPLRTCAIPERLRGVFTTRRYTNTRTPLPFTFTPSDATAAHRAVVLERGVCSERCERWRRQHGDQHRASERAKSPEFSAAGRRRNVRNLVHTDWAGRPSRQRLLQQRTRTRYAL